MSEESKFEQIKNFEGQAGASEAEKSKSEIIEEKIGKKILIGIGWNIEIFHCRKWRRSGGDFFPKNNLIVTKIFFLNKIVTKIIIAENLKNFRKWRYNWV